MKTVKATVKDAFQTFKDRFEYTSAMQAPRLVKVVVNVGTGKSQGDKHKAALVQDRLARITGQKPKSNPAKQSIAGFKLRQGTIVGYQVTLRGERMYDFIEKLVNIALPRTRDFRGLDTNGLDEMGNYSFGIKEHTIFPETADEDISDVFSIGMTIVTTAKTKEETEALLRSINFPLRKEE